MILSLIGLILSFGGSGMLVWDALFNYGKLKPFTITEYPDNPKLRKIYYYDHDEKGAHEVKMNKEQKKLICSLSLISLGFLLQVLDLVPKEFWVSLIQFLR